MLLLCLVGVYWINNSMLDIWLMIGFGLLGYVMRRLEYDSAPLVLALVLGPMMERSFREAMMISEGDLTVFFTRPISAALLAAGILAMVVPPAWRPCAGGNDCTAKTPRAPRFDGV